MDLFQNKKKLYLLLWVFRYQEKIYMENEGALQICSRDLWENKFFEQPEQQNLSQTKS